jgi:hypothetical protein
VVEMDPDARTAYERCAAATRPLLNGLQSAVGDTGAVVTRTVQLHASWDGRTRQHEARAGVVATCPPDRSPRIPVAAMDAGASDIQGPAFDVSNRNELQTEALEQAVADARAKAGVLALAAGRGLGAVVGVEDHGASSAVFASAAATEPAIAPDDVVVSASVTVTFALSG